MPELTLTRQVRCPFSAVIEAVEHFHSESDRRVGPIWPLRAKVFCEIAQTRDYTDSARIHEALVIQWRAHAPIPTPRLRGLLTVRPHFAGAMLTLKGQYVPPIGAFGAIFDALFGRHICRWTLERFMNDVCRSLEGEHTRNEGYLERTNDG